VDASHDVAELVLRTDLAATHNRHYRPENKARIGKCRQMRCIARYSVRTSRVFQWPGVKASAEEDTVPKTKEPPEGGSPDSHS